MRALAVSSPERSQRLPDVPTIAEVAVPGYEAFEWNRMLLPAGTPEPIVTKLQKALVEVLQEDAVAKRSSDLGVEPIGSTSEKFEASLKRKAAKWSEVIQKGKIKID